VAVDSEGRPGNIKILRGFHPELDKAAVEAVKQWVFKPYIVEGKAKSVVFTLTVNFELNHKQVSLSN